MKRFAQIEIITVGFMLMTTLAGPVPAAITWSGNVIPSDPSTWDSSTYAHIGHKNNGTMDITGGSTVSNYYGYIGHDPGSSGKVTVDGANSTWTNTNFLYIGFYGNGTLNITDGGTVSNRFGIIGRYSGSTSNVTVDGPGTTWTNDNSLLVGREGNGTLNITDGGLVSVAGTLTIDLNGGDDSFINMATGGKLALFGDADDLLVDFLGLVNGTDAIRYWDSSIADWADIAGATYGIDYTLEYLTEGDLAGYTMLTVPEPATMVLLGLGGLMLRRKKA